MGLRSIPGSMFNVSGSIYQRKIIAEGEKEVKGE